ncbi:MAG: flagellar basal body P-ring formation chaperone FlgA [Armatimonadota bacterium]
MRIHLLLTVILAVFAFPLASLAITLTFPAAAAVGGEQILLREVAKIDGTPEELRVLSQVILGSSPVTGQSRQLSLEMIRVRLRQHGFDPRNITITCAQPVIITRQTIAPTETDLVAAVKKWLTAQQQVAPGEELILVPLSQPATVQLPAGQVTYGFSLLGAVQPNQQSVAINASLGGKVVWHSAVTFRIGRYAQVLVTKIPIARGAQLAPDAVTLERREIGVLSRTPLRDVKALAACRAAVTLPAGTVLTSASIETIPLVKRNEQVHVRTVCGSLVISILAVAGEDGALGDTISVRNPATRKDFCAKVIGAGELELVL